MATGRVKTTGTLTDKLRRSGAMQLSRMQDLAGARIVVKDLPAQDASAEAIRSSWEGEGSTCRVVDRRERPSFGYRAVHIVVHVEGMPVEIQIRTELQDVWAQIVERLGDRWGRGIRYGEDPENPDAIVRSSEGPMFRRDALEVLMSLSEAFATAEAWRAEMISDTRALAETGDFLMHARTRIEENSEVGERMTNKIPPQMMPVRDYFADQLSRSDEPVDQALLAAGEDTTGDQLVQMAELVQELRTRRIRARAGQLEELERTLRNVLQQLAEATDEGE